MWRAALATAVILGATVLGGAAAIGIAKRPYVTSVDLGQDTADAKASLRACRLYASWPIELKPGERLTLERRVCPVGFHKSEDDEDWEDWKVQHEVLLLESQSWWHAKIVAALFSDLDFNTIDIGKTVEGNDAIVWSYWIKCGSCHGGPNGILAWSATSNAYLWNDHWSDAFSSPAEAKLPDDDYSDTPVSLTWEDARKEVLYDAAVYGPGDAHCCPNAGRIAANLVVKDGHLALQGGFTFFPSQPAK